MHLNNPEWVKALKNEFTKPYFKELEKKISDDRENGKLVLPFPYESLVYRAIELTPLSRVKVVILGQDPYPNVENATGLAFSVPAYKPAPPSLRNIFKELKSDLGIDNKFNDLSFWGYQGVLLLNTVLTVNAKESNSHSTYGWKTFTDKVLELVCKNSRFTVYWLLGKEAQTKEDLIIKHSKADSYHLIKLPHPSPLSAHTGFFFSKPFSKTNKLLVDNNLKAIDWRL